MAGTKLGGALAAETNKKLYGEDFYGHIGRMGGKKGKKDGVVKGFDANRELARTAGAKGGRISRRTSKRRILITVGYGD
jgi:general stress protein YciG